LYDASSVALKPRALAVLVEAVVLLGHPFPFLWEILAAAAFVGAHFQ
jgi:hypothetical protein